MATRDYSTPASKRRRRVPLPANVVPFRPSTDRGNRVAGGLLMCGAHVLRLEAQKPEPPPRSVVSPMVDVLCQALHHPHGRALVEEVVDQLLARLDALDAAQADMEPDHDGEAEPDEASGQPATLAPVVVPLRRSLPRSGDQA